MRHALAVAAGLTILSACGHNASGPTSPTPNTQSHIIAGHVTRTLTDTPVAGATVQTPIGTTTTDSSGRFTFTTDTTPPTLLALTIRAAGYLTRETTAKIDLTGNRQDVNVDLISTAAPFSRDYYNELARHSLSTGTPGALRPVANLQQLMIQTTDAATGEPLARALIDRTIATATNTGTALIGSTEWTIAEIDFPPTANGSALLIRITTAPNGTTCGEGSTGGLSAQIVLYAGNPRCGHADDPGYISAATVAHFTGHALGFGHVRDTSATMYEQPTASTPNAAERYHARIAIQRPRGNAPEDKDPFMFALMEAPDAAPSVCRIRAR